MRKYIDFCLHRRSNLLWSPRDSIAVLCVALVSLDGLPMAEDSRVRALVYVYDAFCDRGGAFLLKRFLNDGAPLPKIVGMAKSCFEE